MNGIFRDYLITKGILIGTDVNEHAFEYVFAMANLLAVRITRGGEMASREHLEDLAFALGNRVPAAFYRGFPESVRKLSREALLFDQLLHYTNTYGLGNFDAPDYSRFEEDFARAAFKENVEMRDFVILKEDEGQAVLLSYIKGMLASSRPLSDSQYSLVLAYYRTYGAIDGEIASKNTAVRLLIDTRDLAFSEGLWLSDTIKVLSEIQYRKYDSEFINELNLKNTDRKFLTSLMRKLIKEGKMNLAECYEKKKHFQGLLHHLHFRCENDLESEFVNAMRSRGNGSVYSAVERALAKGDVPTAVTALYQAKGSGAVLRELNYLVSRAEDASDVDFILSHIKASPLLLIQLYLQYSTYRDEGGRVFRFNRFGRLCTHTEDEDEIARRRSRLGPETVAYLTSWCEKELKATLKNRVGAVYIDEQMYKIALPIAETSTQGGFGTLPRGSRLSLPEGKKIRAFTYWEKVNDIDLSVLGIRRDGTVDEFSWRTMWNKQSPGITFSGDQTAGFKGGSEFYDIHFERFMKKHPDVAYLVFANNVFSHMTFDQCICRAGYMMRDNADSGRVFEPKTVSSSFVINTNSTEAYLFGIDLMRREFVWLNTAMRSGTHIAALDDCSFLLDYFRVSEIINVGKFFSLMAERVVNDPCEADIVLSPCELPHREDAEFIRPCDFEMILKYFR